MESLDETAEHLEMAAAKPGNHTHAADAIDRFVYQLASHCQWQWVNYFPMILNCLHDDVQCPIGHTVEPYSLTLVVIRTLTCSVKNDDCKLQYMAKVI